MFIIKVKPVQPIFMTKKLILDPLDPETYIRLLRTSDTDEPVGSISEMDLNPYVLTNYAVGDYVKRRYPASKIGYSNPNKYGSWWRGPYLVTAVSKIPIVYGF